MQNMCSETSQNNAGLIYLDKTTGTICFTLKTIMLDVFALRTISEIKDVTRVMDACVFLDTNDGEEVYELHLFAGLLGISKEKILKEIKDLKFYVGKKVS
jgi:hypothetical protein